MEMPITVVIPDTKGHMVTVPAITTDEGEVIPASAYRQDVKGLKCHGGHCAWCGCEMDQFTRESARGICDECVAKPPAGVAV